ncbi:MAG: hypothetical protein HQ562_01295 [Candidatus Marinimicrobia bacterium]|nr:hypothetical protein [Candidatus Neomarinimicrobiota bacterium]
MNWKKIILSIFIGSIFFIGCGKKEATDLTELKSRLWEGDLIFRITPSDQDLSIWAATGSTFNQVGIILKRKKKFQVYTVDSTVRYMSLEAFVTNSRKGKFVVKRLIDSYEMIDESIAHAIRLAANRYVGRAYDYQLSWENSKFYGPELIWKIYYEGLLVELGKLHTLSDLDLSNRMAQRYVDKYLQVKKPGDFFIVPFFQIFHYEQLETVFESG